jgi:hypothetical protein
MWQHQLCTTSLPAAVKGCKSVYALESVLLEMEAYIASRVYVVRCGVRARLHKSSRTRRALQLQSL